MNPEEIDYNRPVAYDTEGRPLYYRPQATSQLAPEPTQVSQPTETERPPHKNNIVREYRQEKVTEKKEQEDEVKRRHDESARLHPELVLDHDEYVVADIQRHVIGVVRIWLATLAVILVLIFIMVMFSRLVNLDSTELTYLALGGTLLCFLALLIGAAAVSIFRRNRMIVTNERVIHEIQYSLLSARRQTISLEGVEDVSFRQSGLMAMMFNYGTIRLATVGDETTYRFTLVIDPERQLAPVRDAVNDFHSDKARDVKR